MKAFAWLLVIGALAGIGFSLWKLRRGFAERRRATEERYTSMLISTRAASKPGPPPTPEGQRLLLEAAGKAAQAGEPALAIQLYARLLSRFPDGPLAAQARAAVEAQKKIVSAPQSSG